MSTFPPITEVKIRTLTAADLEFADQLRTIAGWNQTPADWQRFRRLAPDGCFLAEIDGVPAGTATITIYGSDLAWIGMVLVRPELRRRGIGRALLLHCLAALRQRGVRTIKLDATPAGADVYLQLGFVAEQTLTRWERPANVLSPSPPPAAPSTASAADDNPRRPVSEDWPACLVLDAAAFGHPRPGYLNELHRDSSGCAVIGPRGHPIACGLLRPGSRAAYLGPVSSYCPVAAAALMDQLLADHVNTPMFCDILDANTAAVDWARARGFRIQRSLTRMRLGVATSAGNPRCMFAIAGPETG